MEEILERPVPRRGEGNRMHALRIVACFALAFSSLSGLVSDRAAAASPCSPRLASLGDAGAGAARRALCRPSRSGERGSASAAVPEVEGPVTGGRGLFGVVGPFVAGTNFDLADVGYEQEEFFISGTARAWTNIGPLHPDGRWTVAPTSSATYKTRILVYRPIDPARFNGVVWVEWLNVSGGIDAAPHWTTGHVELIREGYVWVGVSAQFQGVEGPPTLAGVPLGGLKINDPERYGSLSHPGDSFSYDIFSQAGQAIRRGDPDPLRGLHSQNVVAAGESQSASRLVTYVNAIDPVAQVYDGFLIHSRGGGSARLSQEPEPEVTTPRTVRIRTDRGVPVLTFQTESDTIRSVPDRQPDLGRHRLWEVPGTAHADVYTALLGPPDMGDDPSVFAITVTNAPVPGIIECGSPINSGPQHAVLKASIAALERWVRSGVPPPSAPRLELTGSPPEYLLDENGNVRGGIRTPWVDAPVAKLSGLGQTGPSFCALFGTTIPFDQAALDALYPDHESYVAAVRTSAERAVRRGFLVQADADLLVLAAEQSDIGR
jgi:Alpha/beta hydrolase domain